MLGGEWVWWALGSAGAVYVLTAVAVVVHRLRQNRRQRLRDHFEQLLTVAGGPADESGTRLRQELARTPRGTLSAFVMEPSVSSAVRVAASHTLLARLGEPRVLREARGEGRDRDHWRRIEALRILADTRPDAAMEQLENALATGGRAVIGSAVIILGQIADRRAAVLLIAALTQGRGTRSRIATVLDTFPLDIADLVGPMLLSGTPAVRYWGAMLARRYGADSVLGARLATLAGDKDPLARRAAVETLAAVGGPAAMAAARRCLADPVPYVRAHAVRTVAALGAREVIGQILPRLADQEWWVRYAAKQSLETMGPEIAPDVVPYLSHGDAFARDGAAEVLQNIGAFETWLVRATPESRDPARVEGLRFLASAAGVPIWESVLDRLDTTVRPRAREALADIARLEN